MRVSSLSILALYVICFATGLIATNAGHLDLQYLDVGHVLLDEQKQIYKEIMPDMLHPSGRGYELLAGPLTKRIHHILTLQHSGDRIGDRFPKSDPKTVHN